MRLQELNRLPRRLHRIVTVPAQFDVNAAGIADFAETAQHWREVNFALAKHQVIVDAPLHVFDMDVPEHVFPSSNVRLHRHFAHTMEVADVERQTKRGVIHALKQLRELVHGVDEHSRLRLERESATVSRGELAHSLAAVDKALHQDGG